MIITDGWKDLDEEDLPLLEESLELVLVLDCLVGHVVRGSAHFLVAGLRLEPVQLFRFPLTDLGQFLLHFKVT